MFYNIVKDWEVINNTLVKTYVFADFLSAANFIQKIVDLSEKSQHHPDIFLHSYNYIRVILFTHDKQQITNKDYTFAKQLDDLFYE